MTALPTITSPAPAPAPRIDRATYERLARRARLLSWLSLAWMTVRYTNATSFPGLIYWSADNNGPRAPLGRQSVRLTVDGKALTPLDTGDPGEGGRALMQVSTATS